MATDGVDDRQKIADATELDLRSLERIGDDVMLDYRLKRQ